MYTSVSNQNILEYPKLYIYSCLSFGATYYYCLLKLKRKVHMNLQLLTIGKTGNNRGNIHFRTHRSEKTRTTNLTKYGVLKGEILY